MNEKIRELAEQANIQYVVKISDDNKDIMCVECDNGFPTAKQFEKFAELIIQECKQAIKHEQDYLFDDGQYELSSHFSYLKERIDEHFGVEE